MCIMQVIKRSGEAESVKFDKISMRVSKLQWGLDEKSVDSTKIAQKVCNDIHDKITTSTIDELTAQTAQSMVTVHPNYSVVASRILISNMHKNTNSDYRKVVQELGANELLRNSFVDFVERNHEEIQKRFDFDRDYLFDYFGFKTLEKSYLLRINDCIVERPQFMFMRVALEIHQNNLQDAFETYDFMSQRYFTHATPTLFNSGTRIPQLASCFLQAVKDDSICGIYDTLKESALISKYSGGIGLAFHDVRSANSIIKTSGGKSKGIIPALKQFNETGKYVDQGGKRAGSIAIYLEPWHADIHDFLELRKNHGDEDKRARDLFTALWIPNLFMDRVRSNGKWSLMSPDKSPGLSDKYGTEFNELYLSYEENGQYIRQVNAQELWFTILVSQIETGTPYLLFKDACNEKSNQKNLGTIKCSNLCSEIVEYSDPDETAVCNLASICLPMYVNSDKSFDFDKLAHVTGVIVNNLNNVIDNSFYPVNTAKRSNSRHRPIGIGVQGLADVFFKLKIPFDSLDAKKLNQDIFETMYWAALTKSCQLAQEKGSYETFNGSPASLGTLQFDMWDVTPSDRYDWNLLKGNIQMHGLRNSLLLTQMPTASTAQIMGNTEAAECITSNLYNRRTSSGEFTCVNKYLVDDLHSLGMWSEDTVNILLQDDGSVQNLPDFPDELKAVYKTCWEMSQRHVIDMAADRGAYICQSQSMNLFIARPSTKILSSMYFHAYSKGLKTCVYYLRTKPNSSAVKVALPLKDECLTCSS